MKIKAEKHFSATIANKAPDSSSSRNVAEIDKSDMEVNKIYHIKVVHQSHARQFWIYIHKSRNDLIPCILYRQMVSPTELIEIRTFLD